MDVAGPFAASFQSRLSFLNLSFCSPHVGLVLWSYILFCQPAGYWRWPALVSKVKSKGKGHPCTGTEALYRPSAHRGSRGIALPFHDHGTRRGWGVSITPRPLFTPRKDPVPMVQEAGWAPGPVWIGAENLAPTGIRSPDRPACSQSLYWLSYLALVSKVPHYSFLRQTEHAIYFRNL